jgi:glycosyltransferase involved in cell wall biosynthesis
MRKKSQNLLSVIIPAYRQEKSIRRDLLRIEKVLKKIRYDYEIICVIDGQVDKTFQNAKKTKSEKLKVVGYQNNHGKGYAIRYGMVRAKGNVIAFIDSGMDLDPNGLSMLLEHFEWYDADIIIGSKRHPVSKVNYPWQRRILSFGYQFLIRILFGLQIRDSQVGMKFFRRKVLEDVLPRLLVKKFAFDIEMLAVAHRLGYRRIFEAPVNLEWTEGNSILNKSLWKSICSMMMDTAAIFYRLKIRHYYDTSNKRKWSYDPDLNFKVNIG